MQGNEKAKSEMDAREGKRKGGEEGKRERGIERGREESILQKCFTQ